METVCVKVKCITIIDKRFVDNTGYILFQSVTYKRSRIISLKVNLDQFKICIVNPTRVTKDYVKGDEISNWTQEVKRNYGTNKGKKKEKSNIEQM